MPYRIAVAAGMSGLVMALVSLTSYSGRIQAVTTAAQYHSANLPGPTVPTVPTATTALLRGTSDGGRDHASLPITSDSSSSSSTSSSTSSTSSSLSFASCFARGKWIPRREQPQDNASGSKVDYKWQPDDESCHLPEFDPEEFCLRLNGRSILFVGDSMNQQYFRALGARLAMKKPQRHAHGFAVGFSGKICGSDSGSVLTFLRDDYLNLDETNWEGNWWKQLPQYDIVVLNTGAHTIEPSLHAKHIMGVQNKLEQVYNGTVLWRTTPRGHIGCTDSTDNMIPNQVDNFLPPTSPQDLALYEEYHYDWIHQSNDAYRELLLTSKTSPPTSQKLQLLDVAPITELRPDGHSNPPDDCLHYKDVTVFEPWNQLLLRAIKAQQQETTTTTNMYSSGRV